MFISSKQTFSRVGIKKPRTSFVQVRGRRITFSATRKAHGKTASVSAFMSTKSDEISYVSNLPTKSEKRFILYFYVLYYVLFCCYKSEYIITFRSYAIFD